jgi:FkbM family methyltransferase
MISYAQNDEDVVLARVLGDAPGGFYLDVGASEPELRSVTRHFYERGWRGVNVEPVAAVHAALERERPGDVNLCLALGARPGTLTFFEFEAEGISTLSEDFAAHFERQGLPCRRRTVEVGTLRDVCRAHCPGPIDFMKIDVEGWERQVLEGADWGRFRPRVLLVEATRPNSTEPNWQGWEPLLLAQGYLFAYFDGLNRFYVPREERALLARFPSQWPVTLRQAWRRALERTRRLLGRVP